MVEQEAAAAVDLVVGIGDHLEETISDEMSRNMRQLPFLYYKKAFKNCSTKLFRRGESADNFSRSSPSLSSRSSTRMAQGNTSINILHSSVTRKTLKGFKEIIIIVTKKESARRAGDTVGESILHR